MPSRATAVGGGWVWLVVVTVACSSPAEPDGLAEQLVAAGFPEYLVTAARDVTPLQAEILADGLVTFAEFERSVLAAVACIEEAGFEVFDVQIRVNGFSLHSDLGEDPHLGHRVEDACMREHFDLIAEIYSWQNRPSEEDHARMEGRMWSCLQESGYSFDSLPGLQAALNEDRAGPLGEAYQSCVARLNSELEPAVP